MKAATIISRIALVFLAVLLLAMSATLAYGVVLDYQSRGLVTEGVTVAGTDLSGMTEAEARAAIEDAVSAPMLRPVTVTGIEGQAWTLEPDGIVAIDVDTMVDAAYAPRRSATLAQRLSSHLAEVPLPADVKPVYSVDTSAIATWVAQKATEVDRKPVNAKRKIVKYKFKITPEVYGARVDQAAAVNAIAQTLSAEAALGTDSRTVALPVDDIKPKIVAAKFKQAIIVSISQTKIRLYKGDKLVKTYRCAPGSYAFPTPIGDFKVVTKLKNAPWINPGSDWAKNMPPSIPPGPYNPMGVRKIGINYPGVFMHGIPPSEFGSIGTRASHGCMRMMPSDVEDLFGRVKIGTPVYIRP